MAYNFIWLKLVLQIKRILLTYKRCIFPPHQLWMEKANKTQAHIATPLITFEALNKGSY